MLNKLGTDVQDMKMMTAGRAVVWKQSVIEVLDVQARFS